MNPEPIPELGSAADLARLLERSRQGVQKALDRLKIRPTQRINQIAVYPLESTAEILREAMRAQNGKPNPSTSATHV